MEVWNGIWKKILAWNGIRKKILVWNGRFLVWKWNGRKLPIWNMEKSSSIPYHAMMTSTCTLQICKSNKDFQLNEHTVVRTSDESNRQVGLLSSKCLLQPPELQA